MVARCLEAEDLLDAAWARYEEAIEIDPFSGESYLVRAKVWASLGDWRRAISDAGMAIRRGLDQDDLGEAVELMRRVRSEVR